MKPTCGPCRGNVSWTNASWKTGVVNGSWNGNVSWRRGFVNGSWKRNASWTSASWTSASWNHPSWMIASWTSASSWKSASFWKGSFWQPSVPRPRAAAWKPGLSVCELACSCEFDSFFLFVNRTSKPCTHARSGCFFWSHH